ncbi:hypothetical protein BV924_22945 [Pectobacterium odoriferum]|uniref:Type VI secretion protein n=1 Tax=Pectobacterium odoriferum TaxID=78398 RepID=A0ABD6VJ06_9GAMM|nr:hypothetical protein [Pectobacterium odoriferum]POD89243.1 hypothetical protein BV925_23085 [Pectobacterium odoriferum]POD90688.1 hypothetical protein BVY06_23050 [Pectobacterium odoriferum]POD96652.1 hypothetical protein BVY05_22705 [Pectobacterium odoriferum]POE07568.1 hypothetical protein BV924_22945 [Pectobacterium odoriferum]POE21700.1 hypothetical protein BV926_22855 [Pectobacterium odoriferum]
MLYSLKDLPECYPRPVPPKTSRWFTVLAAMLVISVIFMRIFGRYIDNKHFWLFAIGTPVAVWIVSFGFRMWVWSLQDSKANGFDRRREQWILRETRRTRRALQVLNTTFITAHQEDEQASVAVKMLNNHSIIISQSDWKDEKSKRLSRITTEPEDTPELVISRLLSELIADLPAGQFPENASLVVILDVSSSLSFPAVRDIWQEAWQESGITCAVEYVGSNGPGVVNHWLDHRIKDDAMLLIVGLQIDPVVSNNTAEAAVALLLGNRLTQEALEPLALLHRPDAAPTGELREGMNMAAYNVPLKENIVKNLWLAGLTGEQRAEVIACQNAHPAQSVEDEAVISLDTSMGHAGAAAPWLAIAAATEIARQTQSPQMIICGDTTQNVLWSTLITPIASRQEMDP